MEVGPRKSDRGSSPKRNGPGDDGPGGVSEAGTIAGFRAGPVASGVSDTREPGFRGFFGGFAGGREVQETSGKQGFCEGLGVAANAP